MPDVMMLHVAALAARGNSCRPQAHRTPPTTIAACTKGGLIPCSTTIQCGMSVVILVLDLLGVFFIAVVLQYYKRPNQQRTLNNLSPELRRRIFFVDKR